MSKLRCVHDLLNLLNKLMLDGCEFRVSLSGNGEMSICRRTYPYRSDPFNCGIYIDEKL